MRPPGTHPSSEIGVARVVRRATLGTCLLLLVLHGVFDRAGFARAGPTLRPSAACLRLDPNVASAAELELLPHIGPKLAARIVTYRQSAGGRPAFGCPDDLQNVRGIGPRIVSGLRPVLEFSAARLANAQGLGSDP